MEQAMVPLTQIMSEKQLTKIVLFQTVKKVKGQLYFKHIYQKSKYLELNPNMPLPQMTRRKYFAYVISGQVTLYKHHLQENSSQKDPFAIKQNNLSSAVSSKSRSKSSSQSQLHTNNRCFIRSYQTHEHFGYQQYPLYWNQQLIIQNNPKTTTKLLLYPLDSFYKTFSGVISLVGIQTTAEYLKRLPLFRQVQLQKLLRLSTFCYRIRTLEQTQIMRQDEQIKRLILICEGRVAVKVDAEGVGQSAEDGVNGSNRQRQIQHYFQQGCGYVAGHMQVDQNYANSLFHVTALVQCEIMVIPLNEYSKISKIRNKLKQTGGIGDSVTEWGKIRQLANDSANSNGNRSVNKNKLQLPKNNCNSRNSSYYTGNPNSNSHRNRNQQHQAQVKMKLNNAAEPSAPRKCSYREFKAVDEASFMKRTSVAMFIQNGTGVGVEKEESEKEKISNEMDGMDQTKNNSIDPNRSHSHNSKSNKGRGKKQLKRVQKRNLRKNAARLNSFDSQQADDQSIFDQDKRPNHQNSRSSRTTHQYKPSETYLHPYYQAPGGATSSLKNQRPLTAANNNTFTNTSSHPHYSSHYTSKKLMRPITPNYIYSQSGTRRKKMSSTFYQQQSYQPERATGRSLHQQNQSHHQQFAYQRSSNATTITGKRRTFSGFHSEAEKDCTNPLTDNHYDQSFQKVTMGQICWSKFLQRKQQLQNRELAKVINARLPQSIINSNKEYAIMRPLVHKNSSYVKNYKRRLRHNQKNNFIIIGPLAKSEGQAEMEGNEGNERREGNGKAKTKAPPANAKRYSNNPRSNTKRKQ